MWTPENKFSVVSQGLTFEERLIDCISRMCDVHKNMALHAILFYASIYCDGGENCYSPMEVDDEGKSEDVNFDASNFEKETKIDGEEQASGQNANDLESVSSIASSQNLTIVDERPVDMATLHTNSKQTTDINNDITAKEWSLSSILAREYPVASFSWNSEATVGTECYSAGVPKLITDKSYCMLTKQLKVFALARFGVRLRFQLNGYKFVCGRLIAYFKPLTWSDDTIENLSSITCYPHVFLDASSSNSGVIEIPFTHLLTYFSQVQSSLNNDSTNSLGKIYVKVYNQMRTPTSEKETRTVYGEVYASLLQPSLHLPTSEDYYFSYGDGTLQGMEAFGLKLLEGFLKAGFKSLTGGLVVGGVDLLMNQLGVYDKPIDPTDGDRIINKTIANLCHGVGLDKSVRLSLIPDSVTLTPPDQLGASDGDFDINTMCKIPCLVTTLEWSDTDLTQKSLYDMRLCPTIIAGKYMTYDNTTHATTYSCTMLAYISRAFALWRGPLKIKLQVICSLFHSGRLAIVHDAQGTTNTYSSNFESNKSYNTVIMDIQEKKEIEIDIPFMSVRPWQRCGRLRNESIAPNMSKHYLDTDCVGSVHIFILNPLVHPSSVASKVDVNLFFYAGDGFELAVPVPVAPLSVRNRSIEHQLGNLPMYPYFKNVKTYPPKEYPMIDSLYWQGKRLFDLDRIKNAKDKWYHCVAVVSHPDVVVWLEELHKLSIWYDTAADADKTYCDNLPIYSKPTKVVMGQEQGVEEYTTNRDSTQASVSTTAHSQYKSAAPTTIAENSMNLQTVMRRYYPLFNSGLIRSAYDFTLLSIPVSPSFVPSMEKVSLMSMYNRRYNVHNIAWFSRLFTFFRGSMRYKVVVNAPCSDVYLWHNPVDVAPFNVVSGYSHDDVMVQLSYAADAGATQVQQGFEVEVPFFSAFNQLVHSHVSSKDDLRCRNGTLFIAVRNTKEDLNFSVFVSTGEDFRMNVMRAPPVVYEPWMYPYSNSTSDEIIKNPELQYNLEHSSLTSQYPGNFVFNGKSGGYMVIRPDTTFTEEVEGQEQGWESMNPLAGIHDKVDKVVDSVDYFKESYEKDVLPEIQRVGQMANDVSNNTIPEILNKFDVLAAEVVKASDKVHSMAPGVEDTLDHLRQFTVNTAFATQEIGATATAMKSCVEYVGDLADSMSVFFKTLAYTGLWLNLVNLYRKFTFMNLMQVCINAGCLFKMQIAKIAKFIYENIVATYEGLRPEVHDGAMTTMDEQGLSDLIVDNMESINVVLAALATIVYCTLFGEMPCWSLIKDYVKSKVTGQEQGAASFMRNMHFTNSGFRAIGQAFEYFREKIQDIMDYFIGRECKAVLLERQFKEKAAEVEKWIDDIADLDDEDFFQEAQSNVDLHNKYYRLVDQGKEFTKWLMNEGVSKNVSSVIRDANKKLMEMIKKIKSIRPGHGYRYAPFVVCINGPSSTGKSHMMHHFTDMFRKNLQIPYYNSVYSMPAADKYLSGYEGQTIVEWDDHLQIKEQDGMVGEFVHWCSNTDTRVNMADVDHKGSLFTSKAFILTTNYAYARIEAIRDLEAYQRRRNVVVQVEFAPGWSKQRMVNAPMNHAYEHAVFHIMEPWNEGGGQPQAILRDLSWEQVKAYVNEKHLEWHDKQNKMLDEYFETRPSLRIPNGIVIERSFDGEEQSLEIKIREKGLNEDELLDAQIFVEEFKFADKSIKQQYYEKFCEVYEKVSSSLSNYWRLMKIKLHRGVHAVYDYIKEFYKNHPYLATGMAAITALLGTGLALKGVMSLFADSGIVDEEVYQGEPHAVPRLRVVAEGGHYAVDPKVVVRPKVIAEVGNCIPRLENVITTDVVQAEELHLHEQGSSDPDALNVARKKIYHHISQIGWANDRYNLLMQGVHVGGKVLMAPHHFFRRAIDGEYFFILRGNYKIDVEFSSQRLVRINDKDLCLYYLGAQIDSRKKIMDCFVSEKYLSFIAKKVEAVLVGLTPQGVMIEKACKAEGNIRMTYQGSDDNAPIYCQYGWKYNVHTEKGECGSVLIACSKLLPPPAKIVGMHTAGYSDKTGGFSVIITKEQVEQAFLTLEERFGAHVIGCGVPAQVCSDQTVFEEQCKVIPEGDFSYYGTMDTKFCPSQPRKTNFAKTPYYEELYPATKKPAALNVINGISPLRKALNKYGKEVKPFPLKHIKAVRNSIFIDLCKLDSDLPAEPTDLTTAVFGNSYIKYCDRLNMNSSPGWPYQCLNKLEKGKAYLFDINNQKITDELLLRNIDEREKAAMEGERVPSIWRDCLKDELRPIPKVEEGKTRLFTIGPVDFTILVRKYFLSFEQAFYKGHSTFFSAVGINPESFEWTAAYNRLRSYGNYCVAGDFGSFDGTLMADLIFEVGELINDWYAAKGETCPYAATVRRVLIDEMIHTYQLVQNCVYKTHKGNPSGNPLTVVINTIVNAFYMRLAWMSIMSEENPLLASMDCYQENVIEEMYGDDNRLVIKKPMLKWYNQNTISRCLAKHGIEYTDETKNKVFADFKMLEDTSFLKRSYRWDSQVGKEYVLPKMDIETLRSLTNWSRTNIDLEDQLRANQRAILGFAFFHGPEVFEEFKIGLEKKMLEHDLTPLSITYDEMLDLFMDDIQHSRCNYGVRMGMDSVQDVGTL